MKNECDIDTNLQPAIDFFKTPAELAKALDITPMAITQWKKRGIPPKRARQIAEITRGRVRASDIKPKFFGSQT